MLVLSRRINEAIRIRDDICITVVSVEGGAVKLGIVAPATVSIHREEIYQRILEENKQAAAHQPELLRNLSRQWSEHQKKGAL